MARRSRARTTTPTPATSGRAAAAGPEPADLFDHDRLAATGDPGFGVPRAVRPPIRDGSRPAHTIPSSRAKSAIWPAVLEGLLDAPGGRRADALVDRECLQQVCGGAVGVALSEAAVADSFQGSRFLGSRADAAGDGERPGVQVTGPGGGRGAERELAEAIQRFGLAKQVTEAFEKRQGLLVAGGGGWVVGGLLLDKAEVVEGVRLADQFAEVFEQGQGLPLAGGGGPIVPGLLLHNSKIVEGLSLAGQVVKLAEQRQR